MISNNICRDRNLKIIFGLTIFTIVLSAGITGATALKADNSNGESYINTQDIVGGQGEGATAGGKPAIVNLQVDLEKEGDETTVYNILNEIEKRDWRVTVYVTEKFALNHSDVIRDIHYRGHQIAIHEQNDENISNSDYNSQLYLIDRTIKIVSEIIGEDKKISHFKPYTYIGYDIENNLKILQNLGILSITGLFRGNEKSYTDYGVVAIPISSLKNDAEEIILDDNLIFNNTNTTSRQYLDYLKRTYDDAYLLKQPMVTVVHSSIAGKDEDKLISLIQFLDYIKESTGKVVTSDSIIPAANQSISSVSKAAKSNPVVSEAMSQSGGIITGKVTAANGTPVANTYVSVSGQIYRSTYTDANGNYNLEGLSAGDYIISFSPPYGSDLMSNSTVRHLALDETVTADIILKTGGIVTGRVTAANGTPVANAYVSASGPTYTSANTDSNGDYRLRGLSAGDYIISISPPYGSDLMINSTIRHVALDETVTADIILKTGGIITGRVTTANGTPVANTYIYASGPTYTSANTDSNGNYRLGGLSAGDYIISVSPPYGSDLISNSTIRHVALDETVTADIILKTGGIITGRVTTVNGTPVANAYVYTSGPTYTSDYTDANGNYRLRGLSAGDYISRANPPYGSDLISNSTIVHVTLDETVTANILLQAGGEITGIITTVNGTPVADVFVSVSGPTFRSTYSDRNGRYRLGGLSAGNYTVYAESRYENLAINYTTVKVAFDEIVTNDIILQVGGVITGNVTSPDGTPAAYAYVSVHGPSYRSTYTDAKGNYRLRGLSSGDYIISVSPPYESNLISSSTFVSVTLGETVTADIVLKVGGVISGNVTAANGTPVVNAYVYASGPSYRSTYTDANGSYSLGGLSSGDYVIRFSPPYGSDLMSNSTFVHFAQDETVTANIILQVGGVITGKVTTLDGTPLYTSISAFGPVQSEAYTDANGRYRLGGLPAGNYTVYATYLGSKYSNVSVRPGEVSIADLVVITQTPLPVPPIPEIPTVAMVSIGMLMLSAMIIFRKKG
ncbi:MAG TPA: carboxypeptidase regulatory-like domain-containing protein [Candidatus Methylomirabilis sp.]|nr:carboxypeptidase regulatory-like domain-containing protein [Candidatus Methylomirabilis sp.]